MKERKESASVCSYTFCLWPGCQGAQNLLIGQTHHLSIEMWQRSIVKEMRQNLDENVEELYEEMGRNFSGEKENIQNREAT